MGCSTREYKPYTDWYRRFILRRVHTLPQDIITYAFPSAQHTGLCQEEWTILCLLQCLSCMVECLRSLDNLRFAEMEELFRERALVQDSPAVPNAHYSHTTENSAAVTKLVFFAFGLLTFFFQPQVAPDGQFTLQAEGQSWRRERVPCLPIARNQGTTLGSVVWTFNERTPLSRLKATAYRGARQEDALFSLNINYYTLSKLAKISIAWTETATRHLELDTRNKTLYLFCYPSFCALMCGALQSRYQDDGLGQPDSCFLNRLVVFFVPALAMTN